jgi:hypothetical protein
MKKSILEQALLQVQDLEEAVKQNAKGILASTMKEELNEVLKETMEEEVVEGNETPITEDEQDIPISEQFDDEEGNDDEASINDEPSDDEDPDLEDEGSEESDELDIDDIDSEDEDEESAIDDEGDDDVLDMTDASDEEVLKVFKSMKPEDGIVVKKDGDNVELEDGDDEYIIKLDSEEGDIDEETNEGDTHEMGEGDVEEETNEEVSEEEVSEETNEEVAEEEVSEEVSEETNEEVAEEEVSEGDDTVYEIELDDVDEEEVSEEVAEEEVSEEVSEETNEDVAEEVSEEEVSEEEVSEEEETHEEDVDEAARTTSNVHGDKGGANRAGIKGKTKYKAGAINEEVETLKKQNTEYKKALVLFKEKLNEVAVFNANLAYATRLFTEHSTTRQEKLNILKRFDSVTSLTESKSTYKTIKTELDSSKNITETVVDKIASTPTTSSSQEVLSETKAYESPQFKRMKDLMSKLK